MMYEASQAFKIFAQSAEATIKGLCANYGHELCASVVNAYMQKSFFLEMLQENWTKINCKTEI